MNRAKIEPDEVGRLMDLPGFEVNSPLVGKTHLGHVERTVIGYVMVDYKIKIMS